MSYYARRISQSIITMISVITITFLIIKYLPGGPMDYLESLLQRQGRGGEIGELTDLYLSFNPETPIWVQYYDYLSGVLTGDLGTSIYTSKPVSEMLANALPWTIFYASLSLIITYVVSIALGGILAYNEGSKFDIASTGVLMVFNSVPYYIVGMLLLSVLAFEHGFFPTSSRYDPTTTPGLNLPFIVGAFHHAALLMASFIVTTTGGIAISARGNSISILGSDYLRVGRLRGLSSSRIATRYVARNAMLPLYTQFMISMGYVFGGSTVLEMVFRYPGAGKLIIDALSTRDMPLMMGTFLVLTLAVVIGVFIADMTYGLLDPRTKSNGGESSGV